VWGALIWGRGSYCLWAEGCGVRAWSWEAVWVLWELSEAVCSLRGARSARSPSSLSLCALGGSEGLSCWGVLWRGGSSPAVAEAGLLGCCSTRCLRSPPHQGAAGFAAPHPTSIQASPSSQLCCSPLSRTARLWGSTGQSWATEVTGEGDSTAAGCP